MLNTNLDKCYSTTYIKERANYDARQLKQGELVAEVTKEYSCVWFKDRGLITLDKVQGLRDNILCIYLNPLNATSKDLPKGKLLLSYKILNKRTLSISNKYFSEDILPREIIQQMANEYFDNYENLPYANPLSDAKKLMLSQLTQIPTEENKLYLGMSRIGFFTYKNEKYSVSFKAKKSSGTIVYIPNFRKNLFGTNQYNKIVGNVEFILSKELMTSLLTNWLVENSSKLDA